jgi:F-type H+-transporting ATPase subunit delta
MDIISSRYAESLFELAKEEKAIETYQNDMLKVQEVFQTDSSFVQFFSHVAIEDDIKINLLDKSFKNQISEYVLNFLKLLVMKRRMRYILGICEVFQSLCNDYFGIKVGKVFSPYQLDEKEIHKIENAVSQKENKKIQLRLVIDESLIGGIKVEVDNHVYDDSLANKLETLKNELLRK